MMKRFKSVLLLHCMVLLYSVTGILSKKAAALDFFSFKWFVFYGAILFVLGVYAILWQQILKKLPLNFAYANKAATVVWGLVFGVLIFKETVDLKHAVGAAIVILGVIVTLGSGSAEGKNASVDAGVASEEDRDDD